MFPFSGPGAASWKNHSISLPQSSSQWGELGPFPPVSQAPGCLPWVPVQTADHAALVCVVGSCLKVPVGRQVS